MSDGAATFSVEDSTLPRSEDHREALNKRATGLLPDDDLIVYTHDKERTLSVVDVLTYESDGYNVPRRWVNRAIGANETAAILEGYGTEYVLYGEDGARTMAPWLVWPSNRGVYVCGIQITQRETEIVADQRASDILWRVDAHDGR